MVKYIDGNFWVALFDENGCLINAKYRPGATEKKSGNKVFLTPGVLFTEESIGTNAVSIAKLLNKPVCLNPEFHYCSMLKKWYEYCVPIQKSSFTNAFVAVISTQYPLTRALRGFIDLLGFNLQIDNHTVNCDLSRPLTEKQIVMIKMIAQGLSDEYMSLELKLSLSTIKYHNQEIFKKLNATGRVDAVMKAIALNELTMNDLYDLSHK